MLTYTSKVRPDEFRLDLVKLEVRHNGLYCLNSWMVSQIPIICLPPPLMPIQ